MPTNTYQCTKDASALKSSTLDGWSGYDLHHPVGLSTTGVNKFRSLLYFPISFAGMTSITSATLHLYEHTNNPKHCLHTGSTATMYVNRMTFDWGEGTNRGENVWSASESWNFTDEGNKFTVNQQTSAISGDQTDGANFSVDVTEIVRAWFGGTVPQYGVILRNATETNAAHGLEFYSRHVSGKVPYLEIVYESNVGPNAPVGLTPTGNSVEHSLSPNLTGTKDDLDVGDYISAYQIITFEDDGSNVKWDSDSIETFFNPSTFSKPYSGPVLTGNTFYKWMARTSDKAGVWGPYSALNRFKVNSPPAMPTVAIKESPLDNIKTLQPTILITHEDPDPTDTIMYDYRVILSDVNNTPIWDSGDIQWFAKTKSFIYQGPVLAWGGTYNVRARTRDSNLAWGEFSENTQFTVHQTSTPDGLDPINSEVVSNLRPTFTAERGSTDDIISSYRIYVYASDGSTVVHDSGILTTGIVSGRSISYTMTSDLAYSTTYLWKIAFNANTADVGGISPYTSNQVFITPLDDTIPTQLAPLGVEITTLTPTFSGARASAPFTSFKIIVYEANGTTVKHDTGTVVIASSNNYTYVYSGPALLYETTYRWKVQVGGGTFTGLAMFMTPAAGQPTLTSPIKGEFIKTLQTSYHAFRNLPKGLPGMVAYYRMADTGTVLKDELENADGVWAGTHPLAAGPSLDGSSATNLNGTSSATVANVAPFDLGDTFSISLWFKRSATQGVVQVLTDKGPDGPAIALFGDNKVYLYKSFDGSIVASTITITDQLWHHLVVTKSGATVKLWLDSVDCTGTVTNATISNTANSQFIGSNYSSGELFPGSLASAVWFNRVLTTREVFDLFQSATNPDALWGQTYNGETLTDVQVLVFGPSGAQVWDSGMVDVTDATSFDKSYTGPLLAGGLNYQWQARYKKSSGASGPYSPPASFHLNAAPSIPTSLSPSPGAVIANTTNPTFKATFADLDIPVGDFPKEWVIEVRNATTDALIQTKTITSGLLTGENVYVWNTDAADVDMAYNISYKWRTYFKDFFDVAGATSGYSVFIMGQPPVPDITSPLGTAGTPAILATVRPTITWSYTDPGNYAQNRFSVEVYRVSDNVKVYGISQISSLRDFTIPVGYLSNAETYRVQLTVTNNQGIVSIVDENTYFTVTLDSPYPITVFNSYVDEEKSRISLRWEPVSDKAGQTFSYYIVYRRLISESTWEALDLVHVRTDFTYYDWRAGHGISYEYKVTQVAVTEDGVEVESPDSPFIQSALESDVWFFIGADREPNNIFELPVVSESHTRPVQSETFEPLGGDRKVVARGAVLGHEGTITTVWDVSELDIGRKAVNSMIAFNGPHVLKSPFGDVWLVECSTPTFTYIPSGTMEVQITWVEVA